MTLFKNHEAVASMPQWLRVASRVARPGASRQPKPLGVTPSHPFGDASGEVLHQVISTRMINV